MKLVLSFDGASTEKDFRIAGDGQSAHHWLSVALSVLEIPFCTKFTETSFELIVSKIFDARKIFQIKRSPATFSTHFRTVSVNLWTKLLEAILILSDGKEKHRRIAGDGQ